MHQPLHDEDNGDKGGNSRHVIFEGKLDNLRWVWDTGLLRDINRDPQEVAGELEQRISLQARSDWEKGTIEDWVIQGHRLAQSVAYGDLPAGDPAPITAAYETQADPRYRGLTREGRHPTGIPPEPSPSVNDSAPQGIEYCGPTSKLLVGRRFPNRYPRRRSLSA